MTLTESRNTYLDQVVAQQQQLEDNLRSKRSAQVYAKPDLRPILREEELPQEASYDEDSPTGFPRQRARETRGAPGGRPGAPPGDVAAVEVRVTGFGPWRTVLVPPNAFVVHTRRGHAEPLHVGLGVSFRYRPRTDSYLVVPGAMQTILISAFSICRELQGVVVQAYVQWIIQDFGTAYRKLDFSDPYEPMRLVNLQLKEQAEAAIKDKVATMSVHEVLSDKQPIIEELTARLRAVAEGQGDGDEGLGLRIVTVQIKEAVVSSARLWENLQKPYRSEQARLARLAELAAEDAISEREMAAARVRETRRITDERELAELRHRNEAAGFDRETAERVRRLRLQRDRQAEENEIEHRRIEGELALRQLQQSGALEIAGAQAAADHDRALLDLERDRIRADIDNTRSPEHIQARLVDALPEIVRGLPKPAELKAVTIGSSDTTTVSGLLAELGAIVGALRSAS